MLDIRMITFLTVAKIKSYTKAGEILNLTQPAVSQHIKYLEQFYNVSLIRKQGRGISLTDEGEILYKYARELEITYRELQKELSSKKGIHKVYTVGATLTIGGYVLPYILGKYKNSNNNTDILLQVNNTEEVLEKLLNRKINLAIVEGPFDRNRFNYIKFKDDELVLAISPEHPYALKGEVDIDEILEGNLILREKGSGTRKVFEDVLKSSGYDVENLQPYMEIGSIEAIKSMVELNLGYTIISVETIKNEMKAGKICTVGIRGINILREFNFVYLKENNDEFMKQFIDFCCAKDV